MNRLRELRKERGLTQKQVAEELFVCTNTYIKWEEGLRNPPIEQLIALSAFFEVSVDYIIGNSDDCGILAVNAQFTDEQKHLAKVYERLNPSAKKSLLGYLDSLKSGKNV